MSTRDDDTGEVARRPDPRTGVRRVTLTDLAELARPHPLSDDQRDRLLWEAAQTLAALEARVNRLTQGSAT
jgi:hypothetical protein